MKSLRVLIASAFFLVVSAVPAGAATITLTPSTPGVIGVNAGPGNCEFACVLAAFGLPAGTILNLLYTANVNGPEGGSFAANYTTTFSNTPSDPADADIVWDGPAAITCPACYLAIKDGNQDPSYYFYNLSTWNGTDEIELRGFWPNQGAISHISIWGAVGPDQQCIGCVVTPEPATLFMLGGGLIALSAAVRRRRRA